MKKEFLHVDDEPSREVLFRYTSNICQVSLKNLSFAQKAENLDRLNTV